LGGTDPPDQARASTPAGDQTQARLAEREGRVADRDPQRAGAQQLTAAAEGLAVDRSDGDPRSALQPVQQPLHAQRHGSGGAPAAQALKVAQIAAGAERTAAAGGQDQDANPARAIEPIESGLQRSHQRAVDRVVDFRPIQGQQRQPCFGLKSQHGRTTALRGRRRQPGRRRS
jgi:hypothetical protein